LIEQIQRLAITTGIKVDDIRPALTDVLVRARIPRSSKEWLAVEATSKGCLFAAHHRSGWKSVRFVRYSDMPGTTLHNLIARECLLVAGATTLPIYLSQDNMIRCTTLELLEEESVNG
jgi:hypothetical protein